MGWRGDGEERFSEESGVRCFPLARPPLPNSRLPPLSSLMLTPPFTSPILERASCFAAHCVTMCVRSPCSRPVARAGQGEQMVAICLRMYSRPRISGTSGRGGYSGYDGRGRPGFVAPEQQLQYSIYRVTSSTAVQQYNRDSSTPEFHTTHAERWSADYDLQVTSHIL